MPGRSTVRRGRAKRRRQLKRRRQYIAPVLIALLCLILFSLGIVILMGQQSEKVQLARTNHELREELESAEEESRRLAQVEAQIGSPEYIEKIARQELGMGREDEIFFVDGP